MSPGTQTCPRCNQEVEFGDVTKVDGEWMCFGCAAEAKKDPEADAKMAAAKAACPGCDKDQKTLVCPGCAAKHTDFYLPGIVMKALRGEDVVLQCDQCGANTMLVDKSMVCAACDWIAPTINEQMVERYKRLDGNMPVKAGQCPGCMATGTNPEVDFPIGCPSCSTRVFFKQAAISKTDDTVSDCHSCGRSIAVPPTIWCSDCGRNLVPQGRIVKLVAEHNQIKPGAKKKWWQFWK